MLQVNILNLDILRTERKIGILNHVIIIRDDCDQDFNSEIAEMFNESSL